MASAENGDPVNNYGTGYARLYSGKTRKLLYNFPAPQEGDHFGVCVNSAGDVDADGHADFIGGDPGDMTGSPKRGSFRCYSGKDGKQLLSSL